MVLGRHQCGNGKKPSQERYFVLSIMYYVRIENCVMLWATMMSSHQSDILNRAGRTTCSQGSVPFRGKGWVSRQPNNEPKKEEEEARRRQIANHSRRATNNLQRVRRGRSQSTGSMRRPTTWKAVHPSCSLHAACVSARPLTMLHPILVLTQCACVCHGLPNLAHLVQVRPGREELEPNSRLQSLKALLQQKHVAGQPTYSAQAGAA